MSDWSHDFYRQALDRALVDEAADFLDDIRNQPLEDILVALSGRFGARQMFTSIKDIESFVRKASETLESAMTRMTNAVMRILPIVRLEQQEFAKEQMLTQGLMNIASEAARKRINETIAHSIQSGEQALYSDLLLVAETAELTSKDMPATEVTANINYFAKQGEVTTVSSAIVCNHNVAEEHQLNAGYVPNPDNNYARSMSGDRRSRTRPTGQDRAREAKVERRSMSRDRQSQNRSEKTDTNRNISDRSTASSSNPPERRDKSAPRADFRSSGSRTSSSYRPNSQERKPEREEKPEHEGQRQTGSAATRGDSRYRSPSPNIRDATRFFSNYLARRSQEVEGRDRSRQRDRQEVNITPRRDDQRDPSWGRFRDYRGRSPVPSNRDSRSESWTRRERDSSRDQGRYQPGRSQDRSRTSGQGQRGSQRPRDDSRSRGDGKGVWFRQGDRRQREDRRNRQPREQPGMGNTSNNYFWHPNINCPDCTVCDYMNAPAGNHMVVLCPKHDPRRTRKPLASIMSANVEATEEDDQTPPAEKQSN
jgi:hypothetical protein